MLACPGTEWPHPENYCAVTSVVSTEGRRPERRDLLSAIGCLSWREGLSAPRFALRYETTGVAICDSRSSG